MGFFKEISQVDSKTIKWEKLFILVSPFQSRLLGFEGFFSMQIDWTHILLIIKYP